MPRINMTYDYPRSNKYEYKTRIVRINLDKEREQSVANGEGFIITGSKPIKDDITDPNGIFSSRYGISLKDVQVNPTRYRCSCGATISRFMQGQKCPICGTEVKFLDDNFDYFGWIVLKEPYHIIHPSMYMMLSSFIGGEIFNNIISPNFKKDEDGNPLKNVKIPKNEPYYGIGMIEFKNNFDEIMNFYKNKNSSKPAKIDLYDDIMENKDIVFARSIPVFTTILRPYRLDGEDLHYEGTNAIYKMMASIAEKINNDTLRMNRKIKNKNALLYDMQIKIKELYEEINQILSGKKGIVRQLYGGRFNFTARSVIVPDPKLRPDQIKLSYPCLCGLLNQRIINVLTKSHGMRYHEAYMYVDKHTDDIDPLIVNILNSFISYDCEGKGIPCIINRNPTITYGGIIQCYCVGISYGYTMQMPLTVLDGLNADFDGDSLNILYIINDQFRKSAERVLNPVNMIISKNDGQFNTSYLQKRDSIICLNTLSRLGRDSYTKEDIKRLKNKKEWL